MTISDLDKIIFKKIKPGKACDVYHLTVEHLRHCGSKVRDLILQFIHSILEKSTFSRALNLS